MITMTNGTLLDAQNTKNTKIQSESCALFPSHRTWLFQISEFMNGLECTMATKVMWWQTRPHLWMIFIIFFCIRRKITTWLSHKIYNQDWLAVPFCQYFYGTVLAFRRWKWSRFPWKPFAHVTKQSTTQTQKMPGSIFTVLMQLLWKYFEVHFETEKFCGLCSWCVFSSAIEIGQRYGRFLQKMCNGKVKMMPQRSHRYQQWDKHTPHTHTRTILGIREHLV